LAGASRNPRRPKLTGARARRSRMIPRRAPGRARFALAGAGMLWRTGGPASAPLRPYFSLPTL